MKSPSLTLGIEEEYQIIDPRTRELRSYSTEILEGDHLVLEEVKPELHQSMVEIGTKVCRSPAEARGELVRLRRIVMDLAARKDLRISEVASEMNRRLKEYAPPGVYLAAALVAVHPDSGRMEIWNGGIPGGLWLRDGAAEAAEPLASRHLPLGILDVGDFDSTCVAADTTPGGHILFFSDGLVEAVDAVGEPFGARRLDRQLNGVRAEDGFARALQAVEDHLGGRSAHDDISLLMIDLDQA